MRFSRTKNISVEPEFLSIPKEEVLVDIVEKTIEIESSTKTKNITRWRCRCEKIALKGAVFGDIEISGNDSVLFVPTEDLRSEEIPYIYGALVYFWNLNNHRKTLSLKDIKNENSGTSQISLKFMQETITCSPMPSRSSLRMMERLISLIYTEKTCKLNLLRKSRKSILM